MKDTKLYYKKLFPQPKINEATFVNKEVINKINHC